MIDWCDETLSEEQHWKLYNLLLSLTDVFGIGDDDLGKIGPLSHTINTGSHTPI